MPELTEIRTYDTENYEHDGYVAELTQKCAKCGGEGLFVDKAARAVTDCDACNGGWRLTYSGQALLRFVREWLTHPDVDSEELP